jgi:hypothetical protein
MNTPRVVLDTNILVSAMLSPLGNPAKVFRMFLTRTLDLVFSADILAEYEDVLSRPRLRIPADEDFRYCWWHITPGHTLAAPAQTALIIKQRVLHFEIEPAKP